MCDHLIDGGGYICTECIDECKDWLKRKNKRFRKKFELEQLFKEFIKKEKISNVSYGDQDWDIFDDLIKEFYKNQNG